MKELIIRNSKKLTSIAALRRCRRLASLEILDCGLDAERKRQLARSGYERLDVGL